MIYILGRQPAIGIAELESLYGHQAVRPVGREAVLVQSDHKVDFARLGSSVKSGVILATLPFGDISKLENKLKTIMQNEISSQAEGKILLGISCYGLSASPAKITALGLALKKHIRDDKHSVRLVPNNEAALSSAQVFHNKLTTPLGWELLLIKDKQNIIVARTTDVQNIDSYTLRDRGRPKRDARVGMLPPKLAQTIINLGAVMTSVRGHNQVVLDPFCGTGVVLQEAALMGYSVYGTDIEERMIRYSRDNLNWLVETHKLRFDWYLHQGDATNTRWRQPIDIIACEVYLGRPFTSVPEKEILQKTIADCDTILKKFLQNLHTQTNPGTRMCLAVPAWFVRGKIYHLKTLDHLSDLGYNRMSFVHSDNKDLIYHREDQVVGRELLVITRK